MPKMKKKTLGYIIMILGIVFLVGKATGVLALVSTGGQGDWAYGQLTSDFEVTEYDNDQVIGKISLHADGFFTGQDEAQQRAHDSNPLVIQIYNIDTGEVLHTESVSRVTAKRWDDEGALGRFLMEVNWNNWKCGQTPNPFNVNDPRDFLIACGGVSPNLLCKGYMAVLNCSKEKEIIFPRREAENIGFKTSLNKEIWYFATEQEAEALQPTTRYIEFTAETELEPISLTDDIHLSTSGVIKTSAGLTATDWIIGIGLIIVGAFIAFKKGMRLKI